MSSDRKAPERISDERLAEMLSSLENHGDAKLASIYTSDYLAALRELLSRRQSPPKAATITEEVRGRIAYALTKRMVIDMPTARAAVDEALSSEAHNG